MTVKSDIIGSDTMEHKLPYPRAVFFIAVTEFCERFSYYGMRAVLTIYMRNVLNFSEDLATTVYHVFLLLCYALPVLGGILADSFIGKYKTILYISIVYAIGNLVLSLSSVTPFHLPQVPLTLLGLFLMAVGTGGIKPCVVALGGEQFVLPYQEKQLRQFFSLFLFVVSVGNMLSTVITPVFRRDVSCLGDETCYPLAFGIPASLMLVAIVVFVCGKRRYKTVQPDGNIMVKVVKCITYAIKEKSRSKRNDVKNEKKPHWLDYARSRFDSTLIDDTKGLLRVLVYYLPIPMFFALYEQLGSRWTLQATRMNGLVWGSMIKPDQMQVANAILMFLFIPFFEAAVYPVLRKCNIFKRPLQRMVVGGILAALSFLVAGIIENRVEDSYLLIPHRGETHLSFINTLPCPVKISENYNETLNNLTNTFEKSMRNQSLSSQIIQPKSKYVFFSLKTLRPMEMTIQSDCPSPLLDSWNGTHRHPKKWTGRVVPLENSYQSLLISETDSGLSVTPLPTPDDIRKSKDGNAKLRIVLSQMEIPKDTDDNRTGRDGIEAVKLINPAGDSKTLEFHLIVAPMSSNDTRINDTILKVTPTFEVEPNRYRMIMMPGKNGTPKLSDWFEMKTGGSYIVGITNDEITNTLETQVETITPPNTIHMLWLVPQYVLMVWAEVLFIISGMEFSFTEAPASMKSVVQSCWHLTNAAGNAIVIISAQFEASQSLEFFVFAGVMGIDMIFFALLAMRYKYVTPDVSEKSLEIEAEKSEESTL